MPISRRAFDNPGNPLEPVVLDFLHLASDSAFTLDEIVAGLAGTGLPVDESSVGAALAQLVLRGQVERNELSGKAYHYWSTRIGYRLF